MTQVLLILSDYNPLQQASQTFLHFNPRPPLLSPPPLSSFLFWKPWPNHHGRLGVKNLQQSKNDSSPAPQMTELRPLVKNLTSEKWHVMDWTLPGQFYQTSLIVSPQNMFKHKQAKMQRPLTNGNDGTFPHGQSWGSQLGQQGLSDVAVEGHQQTWKHNSHIHGLSREQSGPPTVLNRLRRHHFQSPTGYPPYLSDLT